MIIYIVTHMTSGLLLPFSSTLSAGTLDGREAGMLQKPGQLVAAETSENRVSPEERRVLHTSSCLGYLLR